MHRFLLVLFSEYWFGFLNIQKPHSSEKGAKMAVDIIKAEQVELTNNKLRNYTEQIYKQGLNIRKAFAKVAVILVKIEDCKCYEQDGFESVQDYALKVLGWKSATTYNMLRIGREYIDAKSLESVLPHEEGNDYSNSQLQALLPLKSVDTAKALAEKEIISPDMTVKEIKDVVKSYKAVNTKFEGKETDSEGEENASTESDIVETRAWSTEHIIEIIKYADGSIGYLFDDVVIERDELINRVSAFN